MKPKRIPDVEYQQYIWMDKYRRGIAVSTIAREHDVTSQYIYRRLAKLSGRQWEEERLNHNMSRPGAQERITRRETIHAMAEKGATWDEIAQATGATFRLIKRTLTPSITRHMERYRAIIRDYESGMLQKEVAEKYSLGQSTVSSIISRYKGTRSSFTMRNREIIRKRRSGVSIKDLAHHYNLTERRIQYIISVNKQEERDAAHGRC